MVVVPKVICVVCDLSVYGCTRSGLHDAGSFLGTVSRRILSLEMDLNALITLVTIVFSMLKITRRLKIFLRNWPLVLKVTQL